MRKKGFLFRRFATGVGAALVALSFTAGAVAQSTVSEPPATVVISSTSSGQAGINGSVSTNGNTDVSEGKRKPKPKPRPHGPADDFLVVKMQW